MKTATVNNKNDLVPESCYPFSGRILDTLDELTVGQVRSMPIPMSRMSNEDKCAIDEILSRYLLPKDAQRLQDFTLIASIKIR